MLKAAVTSVLRQAYRPIEIIIVDDGSTDETAAVAASITQEYPEIIRVLTQTNMGPGLARENGRRVARGEFIQYLDSDDRLLSNKFTDQTAVLRENPDCGVAYGLTRLVDTEGQVLAEAFKWTNQEFPQLFPGLLVDRWWCTHTPLYRRSVCDQVGPWSDLRYSQDWEYDARVGALGTTLVSTHTLVSEHLTHNEARQTGHGTWLSPPDQIRFFSSLLDCARKAGVENSAPEMQHFSRWVFARARQSGAMGDAESAQKLYELAVQTAVSPDLKMRLIGVVSKAFGWRAAGKLGEFRDRLMGKEGGPHTRKQSWMSTT